MYDLPWHGSRRVHKGDTSISQKKLLAPIISSDHSHPSILSVSVRELLSKFHFSSNLAAERQPSSEPWLGLTAGGNPRGVGCVPASEMWSRSSSCRDSVCSGLVRDWRSLVQVPEKPWLGFVNSKMLKWIKIDEKGLPTQPALSPFPSQPCPAPKVHGPTFRVSEHRRTPRNQLYTVTGICK